MTWQLPLDPTLCSRICVILAHSLWQVGLLAAAAWVVERLWCGRSVQRAYGVCVMAMIGSLAAIPVTYFLVDDIAATTAAAELNVTRPLPAVDHLEALADDPNNQVVVDAASAAPPSVAPLVASPAPADPARAAATIEENPQRWQRLAPWLAACYLAGLFVMLARLVRGIWQAHRLGKASQPIEDGPLPELLQSIARAWSMRVVPVLAVTEKVVMPKVVGLVRPTILLPASAITGLSTGELEMVLAHELAHVRRLDMWVNLLQRLAETVLFFNPALWFLSRRVSRLREYCCDEAACRATGGPEPVRLVRYAQALLHVVELAGTGKSRGEADVAALAAGGRSPSELRRRVARLFGEPLREPIRIPPKGVLALAALAIVMLIGPAAMRQGIDAALSESTPSNEAEDSPPVDESSESELASESTTRSASPSGTAALSGRILLADGSPATTKGWLYSAWTQSDGNSQTSAFKTEGQFTDEFSIEVPAGTVWLKYFGNDFAPAWVGPLEVAAGEERRDVTIEISSGFSVPIHVRDESGAPVASATLIAHPVIGGSSNGPNFEKTTDERGEHVLEHVADTEYTFRVTAPGYEPLSTEPMEMASGELVTLTMQRSLPTTGVVLNADGTPAAGAKIRFRYEAVPDGPNRGASYGFGDVWATTDDAGRFTLDQLKRTSRYLFVVETADHARVVVRDIRAGQEGMHLDVPQRRDLQVRIVGDLDTLPQRNGRPFISVRQEVAIDEENLNHTDLIGEDAFVTPTGDGGVAEYQGLVTGTVRVSAGGERQSVDVNEDGVTKVLFQ